MSEDRLVDLRDVARRLLAVRARLDQRYQQVILDRIIDDLVAALDREEALLLEALVEPTLAAQRKVH